ILPYSSSRGRHAAPPEATTSTGCAPLNQLHTSILCRCCSTIWSPQIHRKLYQLRCCHSRSPHFGSRFLLGKSLVLVKFSTGVPTQLAFMCTMSPISPFFTRLYWSRYHGCERRCAPDFTVSLSSRDFLAAAMKRRMPVASVPMGFSQKTCFLASTAASKCIGRYPGLAASITMSTSLATSFL